MDRITESNRDLSPLETTPGGGGPGLLPLCRQSANWLWFLGHKELTFNIRLQRRQRVRLKASGPIVESFFL